LTQIGAIIAAISAAYGLYRTLYGGTRTVMNPPTRLEASESPITPAANSAPPIYNNITVNTKNRTGSDNMSTKYAENLVETNQQAGVHTEFIRELNRHTGEDNVYANALIDIANDIKTFSAEIPLRMCNHICLCD